MTTKKEVERFYLESFLQLARHEPENINDHETPDFIITLNGKQIGIEVTEFHSDAKGSDGYPRRQIEEEWQKLQQEKLMPEVRQHSNLNTYNGILCFKELNLPFRPQYANFAKEVVRFSLNNCNLKKGEGKEFNAFGSEFPLMRDYLKKFYLRNAGCYITWEWNHNASSVGLNEGELIGAIKKKINRLREGGWPDLPEKWLLVVSGHQISQCMGGKLVQNKLPKFTELNSQLKKSGFDKVFIYQHMFHSVFMFTKEQWSQIQNSF